MHIEGAPPPPNKYFFHRYLTKKNKREIVSTFKINITDHNHEFWDDERNIEETIRKIKYMKPTKKKAPRTNKKLLQKPPQALIWIYSSRLGTMYTCIPEDVEDISGNQ
jgi:hypothetical protein